jgi:DNA-binding NarL/FixJ family response regulator
MSQNINVLIVDDHPFIIQGYKNVIDRFPNKKYNFNYTEGTDCKSGYDIITTANEPFDIALLDVSMPVYEEKNINTGEDLAKLLMETMPNCKIVLLTMHSESLKAQNIIDEINPIGLVIKNDLSFDSMILAIDAILKDERYYSDSIINFLNQQQKEKFYIDVIDRRILHFLNKGIIDDDVALYIPISSSSVKKRIANMKELIKMPDITDAELVAEAKQNGMMMK